MSSTERDEARALEFEWRNNRNSILQSFDELESLAIEATSDGPSGEDALLRLKTFEKAMQIAVKGLQIPIDASELSKATNISLRRLFGWSFDVEELRSQFEVLRMRARSWIGPNGSESLIDPHGKDEDPRSRHKQRSQAEIDLDFEYVDYGDGQTATINRRGCKNPLPLTVEQNAVFRVLVRVYPQSIAPSQLMNWIGADRLTVHRLRESLKAIKLTVTTKVYQLERFED